MALIGRQSPTLIIFGTTQSWADKNWDGQRTGTRVNVETDGGPLVVNFRPEEDNLRPEVGRPTVMIVSVYEGQNGASLSFVRHANGADLDHIKQTALGVKAA